MSEKEKEKKKKRTKYTNQKEGSFYACPSNANS